MNKPVLVVMAAGMGSRYGGLKQVDPVGPNGELIIDFSIYDARRAGFETVIFVIKHEIEQEFKAAIGQRLSKVMDVRYAFQQLDDLPEGYTVPKERVKPWGTCHAVLAARELLDGPFAVINADDYYGPDGFAQIYQYLLSHPDGAVYEYAMVGYLLKNTVTEHGHVARGVCVTDPQGYLANICERTRIEQRGGEICYSEDEGGTWTKLAEDTVVSMNLWGFSKSFLEQAQVRFPAFLEQALAGNPLKGEYFLPSVVSALMGEGKARVRVLQSADRWYGVTYREDRPAVVQALKTMMDAGLYPDSLWGD